MNAEIEEVKNVLIVGAGLIGRRIAVSVALGGFDVTLFDVNPRALSDADAECRRKLGEFSSRSEHLAGVTSSLVGTFHTVGLPQEAAAKADLLIEAVPERIGLKRDVFSQFAKLCPPHTIFTTNTSVLMPSMMVASTQRPDKFAALHFLLDSDMVEITPHSRTAPETISLLEQFSERIAHMPFTCRREQPGHLVNTMLMALNDAALTLAANDVADYEDVDRAWMKAIHVDRGPFGWLDVVGLDTALEIADYGAGITGSAQMKKNADFLRQWVEAGRLGVKNGTGFYTYPDPLYCQEGFLESKQHTSK